MDGVYLIIYDIYNREKKNKIFHANATSEYCFKSKEDAEHFLRSEDYDYIPGWDAWRTFENNGNRKLVGTIVFRDLYKKNIE